MKAGMFQAFEAIDTDKSFLSYQRCPTSEAGSHDKEITHRLCPKSKGWCKHVRNLGTEMKNT